MGNPAITDEELLRMLENSDDDFGLSSGTDLGEGDSGDDDTYRSKTVTSNSTTRRG